MRPEPEPAPEAVLQEFPRLRAGTFIEAIYGLTTHKTHPEFPRLRAGTFIEAGRQVMTIWFIMISPP